MKAGALERRGGASPKPPWLEVPGGPGFGMFGTAANATGAAAGTRAGVGVGA